VIATRDKREFFLSDNFLRYDMRGKERSKLMIGMIIINITEISIVGWGMRRIKTSMNKNRREAWKLATLIEYSKLPSFK
jgi:hypothetical protein